jgi:transcriptional regulator with XRE-family HTH domain
MARVVCRLCRDRLRDFNDREVHVDLGRRLGLTARVSILRACKRGRTQAGDDVVGARRCVELLSGPVRGEIARRARLAFAALLVLDADRLRGCEVRFLREARGDTQVDFARCMGVSRSTALRWERDPDALVPHLESYALRASASVWVMSQPARSFGTTKPSLVMPRHAVRYDAEPLRTGLIVPIHPVVWRGYAPGPIRRLREDEE